MLRDSKGLKRLRKQISFECYKIFFVGDEAGEGVNLICIRIRDLMTMKSGRTKGLIAN